METVGDIGELALIERLKPFCAVHAVGDDAALMSVRSGYQLVVTTDVLVEDVHFSDRTTPPYTVGWRSAAANLSDLAAMGAHPIGLTVGLGLPQQTPWPWVKAFYRGMASCLESCGGAIYGGDLCRAAQRIVSITALGEVQPQWSIRRDQARPGMAVVVTGTHGGSRAGLAVLLGEVERSLPSADAWVRAHQMPVPRFDAIAQLKDIMRETSGDQLANLPVAGMDSSDGLANALLQISRSSGVGIEVFRSAIALPEGLEDAVGAEVALNWALYGGEDFELVLCLPQALADTWAKRGGISVIGRVTMEPGEAVSLLGEGDRLEEITHNSFQHF